MNESLGILEVLMFVLPLLLTIIPLVYPVKRDSPGWNKMTGAGISIIIIGVIYLFLGMKAIGDNKRTESELRDTIYSLKGDLRNVQSDVTLAKGLLNKVGIDLDSVKNNNKDLTDLVKKQEQKLDTTFATFDICATKEDMVLKYNEEKKDYEYPLSLCTGKFPLKEAKIKIYTLLSRNGTIYETTNMDGRVYEYAINNTTGLVDNHGWTTIQHLPIVYQPSDTVFLYLSGYYIDQRNRRYPFHKYLRLYDGIRFNGVNENGIYHVIPLFKKLEKKYG
jgi:hypothetical protein